MKKWKEITNWKDKKKIKQKETKKVQPFSSNSPNLSLHFLSFSFSLFWKHRERRLPAEFDYKFWATKFHFNQFQNSWRKERKKERILIVSVCVWGVKRNIFFKKEQEEKKLKGIKREKWWQQRLLWGYGCFPLLILMAVFLHL